jgi:uncharacterized protein
MRIAFCNWIKASISVGVAVACSAPAHGASFDCALARKPDEIRICSNPALSTLDETMAALYLEIRGEYAEEEFLRNQLESSQREWRETRAACADDECLKAVFNSRIEHLIAVKQSIADSSAEPPMSAEDEADALAEVEADYQEEQAALAGTGDSSQEQLETAALPPDATANRVAPDTVEPPKVPAAPAAEVSQPFDQATEQSAREAAADLSTWVPIGAAIGGAVIAAILVGLFMRRRRNAPADVHRNQRREAPASVVERRIVDRTTPAAQTMSIRVGPVMADSAEARASDVAVATGTEPLKPQPKRTGGLGAKFETQGMMPSHAADPLMAVSKAFALLQWPIKEQSGNTVVGTVGSSVQSFGETITVTMQQDRSIRVRSQSRGIQLMDWGKNKSNVYAFLSALEQVTTAAPGAPAMSQAPADLTAPSPAPIVPPATPGASNASQLAAAKRGEQLAWVGIAVVLVLLGLKGWREFIGIGPTSSAGGTQSEEAAASGGSAAPANRRLEAPGPVLRDGHLSAPNMTVAQFTGIEATYELIDAYDGERKGTLEFSNGFAVETSDNYPDQPDQYMMSDIGDPWTSCRGKEQIIHDAAWNQTLKRWNAVCRADKSHSYNSTGHAGGDYTFTQQAGDLYWVSWNQGGTRTNYWLRPTS